MNTQKQCSFDDCGKPHHAHGLCASHDRQRRKGQPLRPLDYKAPRVKRTCKEDGCQRRAVSLGLCNGHYKQLRKGKALREVGKPKPRRILAAVLRGWVLRACPLQGTV